MKLTLLDIVQRTLSALDSNNVASIGDSVEAEQVVLIVQRMMDEINGRRDWRWLRKEGTLKAALSVNTMSIPDDVLDIKKIWYNDREMTYMKPQDFKSMLVNRSTDNDNVNNDGVIIDSDPKYYTSFDDNIITFDAYDGTQSSTLIVSRSYIYYDSIPDTLWDNEDIPDLPARFHDVLLKGVIGTALLELKADPNAQHYIIEYKRGLSRMLRWAKQIDEDEDVTTNKVDFGRKGVFRCRR